MNDTHLKYLLTVYKYCNLSKAAEEIHISRQALSKVISDLENQFGKQLFIRTKNGLCPTAAVQEMIPHIQIILKEYNHLLDKKDSMEELKDKELTICTFDAFSELFTIDFLQTFMQANPGIILNIEESSDAQATQNLLLGQCEYAIVTDAVDMGEFDHTFLFHSQYGIFVNRNNPLSQKEVVSFSDIEKEKIIGKSRRLKYYTRDTGLILNQGFNLDFIIELTNSGVIRNLVEHNVGIALAWDYSILNRFSNENVVFRPLQYKGWGSDIYLISNKRKQPNKNMKVFARFLLHWIQQEHSSQKG